MSMILQVECLNSTEDLLERQPIQDLFNGRISDEQCIADLHRELGLTPTDVVLADIVMILARLYNETVRHEIDEIYRAFNINGPIRVSGMDSIVTIAYGDSDEDEVGIRVPTPLAH